MFRKSFGRIALGAVVAMTAGFSRWRSPLSLYRARRTGPGARTARHMPSRNGGTRSSSAGQFKKALGPNGQNCSGRDLSPFDMTTGAYIPTFTASVTNTQDDGSRRSTRWPSRRTDPRSTSAASSTRSNGQPRQNFAAVDTATGTLNSSNVTSAPRPKVQAIVATANLVYSAGTSTR